MGLKFLLAVAALAFLFFLPTYHSSYTERILVQAFDQNLRPVEGVETYAEYVLNSVTTNAKTKSKFTNASGLAELSFTNYEEVENETSSVYTVYFKYGNKIESQTLISNRDNKTRVVSWTGAVSHILRIKVYDQHSQPLAANISIGKMRKVADSNGYVAFQLPPSNYTVVAEYGDAIRKKDISISEDKAIDIEIGLYPLEVEVIDDRQNPIVAQVIVENKLKATDKQGKARFENISSEEAEVIVQANSSVKRIPVNLRLQDKLQVVFDRTKPRIKDIHVSPLKTGAATIQLYIEDPGEYASGIGAVIVTYEVEGVENQVPAYSVSYNTYEVKIPSQPPGTLVKYIVKAGDREGNWAFETGTYTIGEEKSELPEKPNKSQQLQVGFLKINEESAGIIVAAAAIVVFALYYYMKHRSDSYIPPAPPQPPKIPQA
jgi:hypothetical protein